MAGPTSTDNSDKCPAQPQSFSHLSPLTTELAGVHCADQEGNQQQWILSGSWSQLFCWHLFLETFRLGGSNRNQETASRRITKSLKMANRENIKTTKRIITRDRKCPGTPSETTNSPSHSNRNWWRTLRMRITSLMLQLSRSSSKEMLTLILNWSTVFLFRSWCNQFIMSCNSVLWSILKNSFYLSNKKNIILINAFL